jgi:hypothetical protein
VQAPRDLLGAGALRGTIALAHRDLLRDAPRGASSTRVRSSRNAARRPAMASKGARSASKSVSRSWTASAIALAVCVLGAGVFVEARGRPRRSRRAGAARMRAVHQEVVRDACGAQRRDAQARELGARQRRDGFVGGDAVEEARDQVERRAAFVGARTRTHVILQCHDVGALAHGTYLPAGPPSGGCRFKTRARGVVRLLLRRAV